MVFRYERQRCKDDCCPRTWKRVEGFVHQRDDIIVEFEGAMLADDVLKRHREHDRSYRCYQPGNDHLLLLEEKQRDGNDHDRYSKDEAEFDEVKA